MFTETKHISNLPFSNELKNKLVSYVENTKGKDARQCGCAVIGCPDTVAITILSAIANDLGCKMYLEDFKSNPTEKDWNMFITNIEDNNSIVAFWNVQQIAPSFFPKLCDAIINYNFTVPFGLTPEEDHTDIPLPEFKWFIFFDEKGSIPFELQEAIFTTIDLSPFRTELRRATVRSTFDKYGLSVNEQAAIQLAKLSCSEQELLSHLFEIRNRAFETGVNAITEDFLSGRQEDIPSIEIVDNMDGREFELFTGKLFYSMGFTDVTVTPSSGDFGADVIAEKDDIRYAVQCKRYSAPVGVAAIQEVIASKSLHDCHVACILTNSTFTPAAVELAKKNLVILWDRKKLKEFIDRSNPYDAAKDPMP